MRENTLKIKILKKKIQRKGRQAKQLTKAAHVIVW